MFLKFLVVTLLVAIILGAIFGGKSFGETVRIGCGIIAFALLIVSIIVFFVGC